MSLDEDTAKIDTDSNDRLFQQRVAPLLVLLFSSVVLWPLGIISFQFAAILLLSSLIYPLGRLTDRMSLEEFGIRFHDLKKGIRENWFLIIAPIVIVMPFAMVVQWIYPSLTEHIINRVPIDLSANPLIVMPLLIIIVPLLEETLFRGFLQRYTAFFAPKTVAIVFASMVFALFHWSSGEALIVALDLLFIFIRGCIYGLIYMRTENALISFIPHALVNLPFW
jgi:membrane protease YdiL (CAAX protease family)